MKKILSLFFLIGISIISNAQCTITRVTPGNTIIQGQQVTYTVPSTLGQCSSCYDWDITGNNTIVGSDQNNTVTILFGSNANFTLSVTYFNETGCNSCTFNYVNPNPPVVITPLPPLSCIGYDPVLDPVTGAYDITNEGTLYRGWIGTPTSTPIPSAGLTFAWTFHFMNGSILTFNVQNPTFRILCPNDVVNFTLLISNGQSSINFTRNCFQHSYCGDGGFRMNNKILISPNPTSSILNFEGTDIEKLNITVYDILGNKVIDNSKIDLPIDISNVRNGILVYKITDGSTIVQEGKIIKE